MVQDNENEVFGDAEPMAAKPVLEPISAANPADGQPAEGVGGAQPEASANTETQETKPQANVSAETQETRHQVSVAKQGDSSAAAKLPVAGWIAIAVAALLIGLLIGVFVLGRSGLGSNKLEGSTIPADKVDSVVGAYSYDGKTKDITAKEVLIQMNGSLDGAKNEKGEYAMPSADAVLNYARTQVMMMEADRRGIKVSDEELNTFLQETYGVSDVKSIADSYGMDEESMKSVLTDSYKMQKLKESVTSGDNSASAPPEAPPMVSSAGGDSGNFASSGASQSASAANAEDESKAVHKEYSDYIIALAGSEWDSSKGTWASPDGKYATALASYNVTAEGATYDAALTAYYVAYEDYAQSAGGSEQAWQDFMQGVLSKASVSIGTLIP